MLCSKRAVYLVRTPFVTPTWIHHHHHIISCRIGKVCDACQKDTSVNHQKEKQGEYRSMEHTM